MALKIRRAKPVDIPALMEMTAKLAASQGLARLMKATVADWRRDLSHEFDALVATDDGTVVGTAITTRQRLPGMTRPLAELLVLYVHEDRRRCGIGAALLRKVITEARAKGAHAIRVTVERNNFAAIRLYGRSKFAFPTTIGPLLLLL
jgi:ribosomal protein S18 acetylase RimI-like enzyme